MKLVPATTIVPKPHPVKLQPKPKPKSTPKSNSQTVIQHKIRLTPWGK